MRLAKAEKRFSQCSLLQRSLEELWTITEGLPTVQELELEIRYSTYIRLYGAPHPSCRSMYTTKMNPILHALHTSKCASAAPFSVCTSVIVHVRRRCLPCVCQHIPAVSSTKTTTPPLCHHHLLFSCFGAACCKVFSHKCLINDFVFSCVVCPMPPLVIRNHRLPLLLLRLPSVSRRSAAENFRGTVCCN